MIGSAFCLCCGVRSLMANSSFLSVIFDSRERVDSSTAAAAGFVAAGAASTQPQAMPVTNNIVITIAERRFMGRLPFTSRTQEKRPGKKGPLLDPIRTDAILEALMRKIE